MPVPGSGIFRKVPRYYDKQLEAEEPELYAEMKQVRAAFSKAHAEEYTPERLLDKYKVKKAQLNMLKRS